MTNFSFVSGAKFRPFSYSEMLAPLQQATTAQMQIEDAYGELGTKADVFERMANEQTDPKAYAMYKQYSNDLAQQAESLVKQGLSPASRQGLIDMKRRYSSDIVPIEQAYKRRGELVDEQRKLQAQDNTLMFDRAASTLSLDELIDNPAISPQSYSGSLLSKQVGTAAGNLAKEVREDPRKWRAILGNQYYETIMQRGYKPEEIMQAIQNNPNASPILMGIVEDAVKSSGISGWNDKQSLDRAYDFARQGLWQAVGDTQYQVQSNKAYDYAMQERLAMLKKKDSEEGTAKKTYKTVGKTSVDRTRNTTQMSEDIKFIQGLRNGSVNLDETRQRTVPGNSYMNQFGAPPKAKVQSYKPNQERVTQMIAKYGVKNLDQLEQKLTADIASSAVRDFIYKPDITQSDLISQSIKENARTLALATESTGLYEYDKNKKGDAIKLKNLNDYFTEDMDLSYDPEVGIILNSTDKKGNTRGIIVDTELIDDPKRNLANDIENINVYLENGHTEAANKKIESLMNRLYFQFNTLSKRQSNTDSKME